MKKFRNGFTLAEILIAIGLVGVISAVVFSTIVHNKPNKNKAMFRKAYYIVERISSEMLMDDDDFPTVDVDGSKGLAYFDPSTDQDDTNAETRNQKNTGKYFCNTFAKKLNKTFVATNACSANKATFYKNPSGGRTYTWMGPSFTTSDGIDWRMTPNIICDPDDKVANPEGSCVIPDDPVPDCARNMNEKLPYICVFVDVNGSGGPDKWLYLKGASANEKFKDADKGWFYVFWNGQIKVPEGQTKEYLKSVTVL